MFFFKIRFKVFNLFVSLDNERHDSEGLTSVCFVFQERFYLPARTNKLDVSGAQTLTSASTLKLFIM